MSYKPYRILREIVIVVNDSIDTISCYPHGKPGKRVKGTSKIPIIYTPGVINAPTDEELAKFNLPGMSDAVKPIPQDPRGFDVRDSGLARSIPTSLKGREAGIIEDFERKAKRKKVSDVGMDDKSIEEGDDNQ